MTQSIKKPEDRMWDKASIEALVKAERDGVNTCFSRLDAQPGPCRFGMEGLCCRICYMGPCRITQKSPRGVCGADADTVVARNFLREVAGGTAAHSDHGRHLVMLLKKAAQGLGTDYVIRDESALRRTAKDYGISEAGRAKEAVALELADLLLREFMLQEEALATLALAPGRRQALWRNQAVAPLGIDRMVVEALHRTHMGVDHDYRNILLHAFRTALADGWGGSRIATQVSDILFGTPSPVRSNANLGVLGKDTVNIIVHGHEPELSEMLVVAVRDPAIEAYAREAGARGITLAGICCTANEILMRHGIPVAGSFLQQELAIVTGAVEMLLVDVQCCMPSLPDVAKHYHTEIVSTTDMAKTVGAVHLALNRDNPLASAKALIRRAVDNFKKRDQAKVAIPDVRSPLVAGFSVDAIKYMLGGRYRASFRPLNDAVIQGRIRGVVGIVGCNNPQTKVDAYINILTRELLKENVLILKTGCAAIASAKEGMLRPGAALEAAGPGLREVCEAVGMPPVLHMGSCVDNSRILEAATEVAREGGLGDDLFQIPAVGVAPEWMSEKAVAIACYFVASGIDVVLGHPFHIGGSDAVTRFLTDETKDLFNAAFHVCDDPVRAAALVIDLLDERRKRLGIDRKAERKLFDMEDRRKLDV
ncbi:MAG: Carbon monoxide dehydrogenase [Syntrophus sp. SKADARSKE-3]|nr:Carbon monoxide dehydrogenase [Syntrophus sp. SKADARSKE-3]